MKGVYKIYNKINNKVYIGSTVNIKNRNQRHFKNLRDGNHHSNKLQNSYNKYGEENFIFEVIEPYSDIENSELLNREQYWIDFYDSYNNGFNSRPKAKNNYGYKHSENTIKILSEKNSGKNNAMYGVKKSQEWIDMIKKVNTGIKRSEETIEKLRKASLNKKHSKETKLKQSRLKKSKPILQLDASFNLIKEWYSKREPFRELGILVHHAIKSKTKYTKGFFWVYKEDYDLFLRDRRN